MGFIDRLSNLGVKEHLADDVKNKIRLANYLIALLIGTILLYTVISFFVAPALIKYCCIGIALYGVNLFFSFLGLQKLSRFCISVFPAIVIAMLHGTIMQEGSPILKEIYAFQIIACLISFTIFDIKKIGYWLPAFLFSFLLLFQIDFFNEYFSASLDESVFYIPWLRTLIVGGAVALGAFLIIFLKQINFNQFTRVNSLLKNIEMENEKARQNEEELKKTLKDLEVAQKEEAKRNWKTSGLAEVGNLLRAETNLDELCDKIIAFIVKYMEANQGALFLLNDEDGNASQELFIKSAYAYERKKWLNQSVQPGEGLVGQCFLEKDYIYLTDVPDEFITIKSGLGDANPRAILITPMLVNEQIYGIFEIASFKKIEQYQIDFMMELGENIAMTLNNFKINERTKKLLEETQEQSEQLRSQEEEMRQNMEELQATQEEQERQQKELVDKIRALESEKAQALERLAEYSN